MKPCLLLKAMVGMVQWVGFYSHGWLQTIADRHVNLVQSRIECDMNGQAYITFYTQLTNERASDQLNAPNFRPVSIFT